MIPITLDILHSKYSICCFQDKFSSIMTPKNFIEEHCSIFDELIVRSGSFKGRLSDCSSVVRLSPIKKIYRNFKYFDEKAFIMDIESHLTSNNFIDFQSFYNMILTTLNTHAPLKEKLIRGNNKPFINKEIRKEVMKRTRLKNKAIKTGLNADMLQYKIQRNYVTSLVRKSKTNYFKTIEITRKQNRFLESM